MSIVTGLLQSGWIGPLAMAILWAETTFLSLRAADPAGRFRALFPNAMSGTCLLGAVSFALIDANVLLVAACLGASLVAHVFDVMARLPIRPKD